MLTLLREEILCSIVLIFLLSYYVRNIFKDRNKYFIVLTSFALAHVLFSAVTLITVNNRDVVPELLNRSLHICFYLTGILFILGFFNYVLHITAFYRYIRMVRYIGLIPLFAFLILMFIFPMEYVTTDHLSYSYGLLAFVGYGIFLVFCVTSLIFILAFRHRLDFRVKHTLVPLIFIMLTFVIAQALIPTLLMTSSALTLVCLGMFLSLDNPDKYFKEQALWDFLTGLKNRNCYTRDLEEYTDRYHGRQRIGFVMADLNYLKTVNDQFGHVEGDKLIAAAAEVLQYNLKSATGVYRLGGDEFVAIYLSPNDEEVAAEMEAVKELCEQVTEFAIPLSIAMGYASGVLNQTVDDIFQEADRLMYENKTFMKETGLAPVNH